MDSKEEMQQKVASGEFLTSGSTNETNGESTSRG